MGPRKRRKIKPVADDNEPSSSEGEEEQDAPGDVCKRARRSAGGGTAGAGAIVSSFFTDQQIKGSSRTLADLQLDAMANEGEEENLRDLITKLPEKHAEHKAALRRRHQLQFGRWWAHLCAGNSVLLYGFGSKHDLLTRFAQQQTGDGASLAVNGLHPGLSAKHILQHACAAMKGTKASHYRGCTKDDALDLMRRDERRLYLALHNIDGPGLRDPAQQRELSELAALPNVHVIATVDHVNAALLWDLQTRDRFSWVWFNATNYAPYLREVAHAAIPSLLVGRAEQASKQSAAVVLASLSHSAREVFRLIADTQLEATREHGVTFQRLFQQCRERFLVSNEVLLRAFLTEFRDHELLATKRGSDGAELLHIPLREEALQAVLSEAEALG